MRIGTKITLGFALVLFLAIALGAVALLSMREAANRANDLAAKQVPAVTVANDIERDTRETLFLVRGYTMSDDEDMGRKGEEMLKEVNAGSFKCKNQFFGS